MSLVPLRAALGLLALSTTAAAAQATDPQVEAILEEAGFNGAALVMLDGKVVHEAGHGMANFEFRTRPARSSEWDP